MHSVRLGISALIYGGILDPGADVGAGGRDD